MTKPKLFVSHVSEEASLALVLKSYLSKDFLRLLDIFVSSDIESIVAGASWLKSMKQALKEASVLLVLCSRASLNRPWVNFEVGAAWIKSIPIVPICHSGFSVQELPMPFSTLQGIEASNATGLKRVYSLIAKELKCRMPDRDFAPLIKDIKAFEKVYAPQVEERFLSAMQRLSGARKRIYEALSERDHVWRTIDRLAVLGGITEDEVLEILVQDPNVVFGKGKKHGKRIARLKDRKR